jgi:predicted alpha/beta superfamily hydrolase
MRRAFAQATCLMFALTATPAFAADPIFGQGFETFAYAYVTAHYPAGAHSIVARGDGGGLSWDAGAPMSRAGDTFTRALPLTAPAQWKPVLDDATFALGPDYSVDPGEAVEVWPRFTTTQGQVYTFLASFHSDVLNNSRAIYAYLPPTYVENPDATFPVVYMQDGQNLWASHPEWSNFGQTWAVDTAFDGAAADGSVQEAIVIGIAAGTDRIYEYTPTVDSEVMAGGGADAYLQMLVQELKPIVDSTLRTRSGAESTVIAGSSLGGLLAVHAGRTKPLVFSRVAALSASAWWDDDEIIGEVQSTPPAPNRPVLVYVDSGSDEENAPSVSQLANAYASVGYVSGTSLKYVVQPGALHNETYWAQRFPGAMQFLLGPRQ